jgi:hypothetical protein
MSSGVDRLGEPVRAPSPLRILVTGAATAAFYDLESDEAQQAVARRLVEMIRDWLGQPDVAFVGSFDDDLLLVGDPRPFGRWSIFMLFDVPTLDAAVAMADEMRRGSVRLHRYFTLSVAVGRPFWPAEDALGGTRPFELGEAT